MACRQQPYQVKKRKKRDSVIFQVWGAGDINSWKKGKCCPFKSISEYFNQQLRGFKFGLRINLNLLKVKKKKKLEREWEAERTLSHTS